MKKQIHYPSFLIACTFFLGMGYSLIFYLSSQDSWISMIIGLFIGNGIILLLKRVQKRRILYSLKSPSLIKISSFLFHVLLLIQILFVCQNFATTFYLPKTPSWFLLIPVFLLIYKVSKSGYRAINSLSKIFLFLLLCLFFMTLIGLAGHLQIDSLFPVYTVDYEHILSSSLVFASYTTIPYFMFLFSKEESFKSLLSYNLSSLFVLFFGMLITLVLGPNLISLYRYPEYAILKEVKIFNFIENMENILAFLFLIPLSISLFLATIHLNQVFKKKNSRVLFPLVLIILYFFSVFLSNCYSQELAFYFYYPLLFFIIEAILILIFFFAYRK